METKYYIDANGVYIGAFSGEHGIDLSNYTEVPYAPNNVLDIWNGTDYTVGAY